MAKTPLELAQRIGLEAIGVLEITGNMGTYFMRDIPTPLAAKYLTKVFLPKEAKRRGFGVTTDYDPSYAGPFPITIEINYQAIRGQI